MRGAVVIGTDPGQARLAIIAPPAVRALIPLFLRDWRDAEPAEDVEAIVECRARARDFEILAPVLPGGRHITASALEAADTLASALAAMRVRAADVILPHAAAIEVPSGLVLLFADSGGGKSTLALTLAASRCRLFGDDRLGLRRAQGRSIGIALGLTAKLRLPPPPSAVALSAFLTGRTRRRWASLAYLDPKPEEQAPAGAVAPVSACLLLDRGGAAPALEPAHPARLVHALAESAAAPWLAPAELMAAAAAHADLPAFHLRYREAADLLRARFGAGN